MTFSTRAYAAQDPKSALGAHTIQRRAATDEDVVIDIAFCGVCHSDLHQARDEWHDAAPTKYPCVPGHEIVGTVREVGAKVQRFKRGDRVAVGCMVDACRACANCLRGLEQYCTSGPVFTYNSGDKHGGHTMGGYSESVVVAESFVLRVPEGLDLAAAAPLLCAGITTYSPLRHWKVGPGKRVGVVGLGGLGHMAVKFARAMGAHVTLFTTSASKIEDGKRLGAHDVIVTREQGALAKVRSSFDFVLDTVSADHDINAYLELLSLDGTLCLVGAPERPLPVKAFSLLLPRRSFAGSGIGGIAETQEMLDFCAQNKIQSDIELIPMQRINEAYERLLASDVRYRFVIDMASLRG